MIELIQQFLLLISGACGSVFNIFKIAKYGTLVSCFMSGILLFLPPTKVAINWFEIGTLNFRFEFQFGITETLVCTIITMILTCLYFSKKVDTIDKLAGKKLGILNVFAFFMYVTISSQNLFQFYIGVEVLGLISSILVSLEKNSYPQSFKVFLFNKFASLLFIVAILLIVTATKSFDFAHIRLMCEGHEQNKLFIPACLLLISCLCKGAQMPFSHWLVDASKANIFASILIHSGTIVTIGIIFIAKCSFLFTCFPVLQKSMVAIGIFTAFWMACSALTHNNVKKVIACLTASSAGLMFVICGVGEYSLATLYLMCHALAKSVLFLCFAYLIFAMSGEKKLFNMTGIGKFFPKIRTTILVALLLNIGFPFVVSFFPKAFFMKYLISREMYLLIAASVVVNIIAIIAILRMVEIITCPRPCREAGDVGIALSKKHDEFNMIPVWILVTVSTFGSFVIWNIYKSGGLCLGWVETSNMYCSHSNYIIETVVEVAQITVAILAIVVLMRFSRLEVDTKLLKFLILIFKHNKIYGAIYSVNQTAALHFAKFVNELNEEIANIASSKVLRGLHFISFMVSKQQKKSLGFHALWMWMGLVVLTVTALIRKP